MENSKIICPKCGQEVTVHVNEFIDVSEEPQHKERILNGTFFLAECPNCGDEILMEYPVMYIDNEKKLNVYMAPDHDDDLLENLNSLEIPTGETDREATFRLTSSCDGLIEKILIADGGRDDRIIELYKLLMAEGLSKDLPGIDSNQFMYYLDGEDEFFIIFGYDTKDEEQLTVHFEEDLYNDLAEKYLDVLTIPVNEYAEVDSKWMKDRIEGYEE